jgi:hypothetical protein
LRRRRQVESEATIAPSRRDKRSTVSGDGDPAGAVLVCGGASGVLIRVPEGSVTGKYSMTGPQTVPVQPVPGMPIPIAAIPPDGTVPNAM